MFENLLVTCTTSRYRATGSNHTPRRVLSRPAAHFSTALPSPGIPPTNPRHTHSCVRPARPLDRLEHDWISIGCRLDINGTWIGYRLDTPHSTTKGGSSVEYNLSLPFPALSCLVLPFLTFSCLFRPRGPGVGVSCEPHHVQASHQLKYYIPLSSSSIMARPRMIPVIRQPLFSNSRIRRSCKLVVHLLQTCCKLVANLLQTCNTWCNSLGMKVCLSHSPRKQAKGWRMIVLVQFVLPHRPQ